MAVATLGFAGGPSVTFRIDPSAIQVNYNVFTSVQETVGGRVVQITGAVVSDITVNGTVGHDHTKGTAGEPFQLAKNFFGQVVAMMNYQSANVDKPATSIPTAVFTYAPLAMRIPVYIKSCIDADGDGTSGVYAKVGKILYRYTLTLFPSQDPGTLVEAGQNGTTFDKGAASAIDAFINRITTTNGLGWKLTQYNGGTAAGAGTSSTTSTTTSNTNNTTTTKSNTTTPATTTTTNPVVARLNAVNNY